MSVRSSMPEVVEEDLASQPLARARTLPAEFYTDPGFESLDRHLLGSEWQYVCALAMLAGDGSCRPYEIAGERLLVLRDGDEVRAFHNVCRHRAGPLVTEPCTVRHLRCRYHGWTYALDGRLIAVPRFEGVEGFDRSENGLVPVRTCVWMGMVFVDLEGVATPLEEQLADLLGAIAPLDLSSKRFHRREVYEVAADWKVYVDNFLESYHVPLVHPLYGEIIDYGEYSDRLGERWSLQMSPWVDDMGYYEQLAESSGERSGMLYYALLFPNLMLNITDGRLQVNHVRPVAPGRCQVVFDYYFDSITEGLAQEDAAASARIQAEDAWICAEVQRNLGSRSYRSGRLSVRMERAVHHFQERLRMRYRDALINDTRGMGR